VQAEAKCSSCAYQKIFYEDNREAYLITKINSPERSRRAFFTNPERSRRLCEFKSDNKHLFCTMLYNTQQEAYYLYIILCNDGSFYTGLTDDLIRRFEEHVNGVY